MNKLLFGLALATALASTADANADSGSFTCKLKEAVYFNTSADKRIHARCTTKSGSIEYFAIGLSSSATAERFLAMITSALISGRNMIFDWNQSSTPNTGGCGSSDCRTPESWGLL